MKNKYDIIVVGSGISGAVIAQKYASEKNKKVLILEKRSHIGGNCYDYFNQDGILIHKYGPHFFHTNYEDVWEYVNKFSDWYTYELKVLSHIDGKEVPLPVNITTVNMVFGLNIKNEAEMLEWIDKNVEKIENPKNSEEAALSRVGKVLYEKMNKNYFKKQWDLWPAELDPSVMMRLPFRTNFDDRYFNDKYQALPEKGYTKMFEKMFDNPNIEVRLETDYFDIQNDVGGYEKLFFTGPIDRFFNNKFEKLQYRSLRIEFETYDKEFYQSGPVIAHPNDHDYTRIVEYKHFTKQNSPKTTISKEYGTWEGEPYYPIPNEKNQKLFQLYKDEAQKLEKDSIYFVGRLANYKYFNMDQAFKNALDLFNEIENNK